jgi:hypothetical protein
MPTRKQRRRREKGRRHEYEYVYVDEGGNEIEVTEEELRAEKPAARDGKTRARPAPTNPRIQPPSWRRVGKRGLIFAPLMFVTVMLLDSGLELWQVAVQTAWLLAIFLPFSYFMDSFMYRRYVRRTGGESAKRERADVK